MTKTDSHRSSSGVQQTPRSSNSAIKLATLVAVVVAGGLLFWAFRDKLSFDYLAGRETELRNWRLDYPFLTAATAVAIYVLLTGLSLPGAAVITLACGWHFGSRQGLLIVSLGSTGGAMVAFLMSRYLLRDWVQATMQHRLAPINEAFEREGAFYLFTLRLVPAVPFFVSNAVMGLTKISARTFWWISQLGMLPGTAAYVYAGSTVPSIKTLADQGVGQVISGKMLLAFAILGVLPLIIKRMMTASRNGPRPVNSQAPTTSVPSKPSIDR